MKQFDEITKLIKDGMSIQSGIEIEEIKLEELESDYDFAIDESNTGNEKFPTYYELEMEVHRIHCRIDNYKGELKDNLLEVYEYYKRTEPLENFWVAISGCPVIDGGA